MKTVLSWEVDHPERSLWTTHTLATLKPHLAQLNTATDIAIFALSYAIATDEEKLAIWGELISAVALKESSWNPCDRYLEKGMGTDPVTGEHVYGEGLLQLSYQDTEGNPELKKLFDWEQDKKLKRDDCSKTILDPLRNLTGGIAILVNQVKHHKAIVLKKPYWSTLGDPGVWKDSKVTEIAAMVGKVPVKGMA
jgi:hypothetical protein